MSVRILHGDNRAVLPTLPSESVHCVVTSPPYWGLRDYGIEPSVWGGSPACAHEWGDEQTKTLTQQTAYETGRAGGEAWAASKKLADAAPIIARQGSFCRLCNAWRGCHGLEPTIELYVQHAVEIFRLVRRVMRDDATLWLNLGDSYHNIRTHMNGGQPKQGFHAARHGQPESGGVNRATSQAGLKEKDLCMIPARVALALQADGWWLRSEIIWAKPNPMPESVTDRPTSAHEKIYLLSKSAKYWYDADAVREPAIHAGRVVSYDGSQKNTNHENRTYPGQNGARDIVVAESRNIRNVWTFATEPFPEAHFATFPTELVRRCILAGCPVGGTVLDPFAGALTTCLVADRLGRNAIGIEVKAEYCELGRKRLAGDVPLFSQDHAQEAASIGAAITGAPPP